MSSSLKTQTKALMKLLTLWPTCPTRVLEEYIQDTLKVTPTRVCIQEAKEELGLSTPQHEEKTLHKMMLTRYYLFELVGTQGGGFPTNQLRRMVTKYLKERFNEATNSRLIARWVDEFLTEARGGFGDTTMRELAMQMRDELTELGILSKEESRQGHIL